MSVFLNFSMSRSPVLLSPLLAAIVVLTLLAPAEGAQEDCGLCELVPGVWLPNKTFSVISNPNVFLLNPCGPVDNPSICSPALSSPAIQVATDDATCIDWGHTVTDLTFNEYTSKFQYVLTGGTPDSDGSSRNSTITISCIFSGESSLQTSSPFNPLPMYLVTPCTSCGCSSREDKIEQ